MTTQDYYQALGVSQEASPQQIKDAYRDLAFQHHPDRNPDNAQAADTMKRVNEAYAVLSNPAKRREYDQLRQQFGSSAQQRFRQSYSEQDIFKGSDIDRIFEEMAKSFGLRGVDAIFRDFYGPGYRRFEFRHPGFTARGFVFSGRRMNSSQPQAPPRLGKFSRLLFKKISGVDLPEAGADLHDVIYLSAAQAHTGGPYAYRHRQRSKKLVVKIPPGIREGQKIRLAGIGQEGKGGGSAGDLYLEVRFEQPWLGKVKRFVKGLFK